MSEHALNRLEKRLVALLEQNKIDEFNKLLSSHDFDVNTTFEDGITLLHFAIIINEKAIDSLHQRGAVISNDSSQFISPIILASLVGKPQVVEKLLTLYPEQQQYITEENG